MTSGHNVLDPESAIEATRICDHLQFRTRMRDAFGAKDNKLKNTKEPKALRSATRRR